MREVVFVFTPAPPCSPVSSVRSRSLVPTTFLLMLPIPEDLEDVHEEGHHLLEGEAFSFDQEVVLLVIEHHLEVSSTEQRSVFGLVVDPELAPPELPIELELPGEAVPHPFVGAQVFARSFGDLEAPRVAVGSQLQLQSAFVATNSDARTHLLESRLDHGLEPLLVSLIHEHVVFCVSSYPFEHEMESKRHSPHFRMVLHDQERCPFLCLVTR